MKFELEFKLVDILSSLIFNFINHYLQSLTFGFPFQSFLTLYIVSLNMFSRFSLYFALCVCVCVCVYVFVLRMHSK
jgi:hypothetical protein